MSVSSPPPGAAPGAAAPRRGLHVITWGCQMNVYDSGRMRDVLAPLGYAPVAAPEDAEVVILNTCHIRDRAAEKVFSELGRLRLVKEERRARGERTVLAVAGCVAQAEGAEVLARAPFVDLVLGPQTYHRLPELLARAHRVGGAVLDTEFPVESKFDHLPEASAPPGVTAFLSVQEGCDKFCSFCVVPYTRGAEASRPAAAVLAEARALAARGARELTLLGQNVNAYHGEAPPGAGGGGAWGLGRLLRALAEVPGLLRLRYTTSHPLDVDEELLRAHAEVPAVMPFLHLPVQSGSDAVLRLMNRRHTAEDYLRVVGRLREARPDLALSSDFIVGHPGETAADHAATLRLVERVGFAQAFSFRYSPRPGTPAAAMGGAVPAALADERLWELQALLRTQQARFNAGMEGRVVPVLVTGAGRHPGQLSGRSPWLQPVHVEGPASLIGREVAVRIVSGNPNSLGGRLAAAPPSGGDVPDAPPDGRAAPGNRAGGPLGRLPLQEPAPA